MKKRIFIDFDSEDLEQNYGIEEKDFKAFCGYMEREIPRFITESNFLENYAEKFNSRRG